MGKKNGAVPSPCVDVCKYKLGKGFCIGCGMNKKQKKRFKKLDGAKEKLAFIDDLREQQLRLGVDRYWLRVYERKCRKKGVSPPLAELG